MRHLLSNFPLLLISVSTYVNTVSAQAVSASFELKGQIQISGKGSPDDVSLQLIRAADRSIVKIEFADAKGAFLFSGLKAGDYLLLAHSMSIQKYESDTIRLKADLNLGLIGLRSADNSLKEVVVTAAKPLIQQSFDKTVINVASSINAVGSTALEVLQKAPGITVDQNDNIAMRGRQGVIIMIDGKLVPMSGQDLANMLKSMTSDQIEKIDLITNPSAKYDASGNSGIIDIRLKKGNNVGTNGSVALSYGQGEYAKFNPSLNFNSRSKKLNVFGSYSFNDRRDYNKLDIFRDFYNNSAQLTGGNNYNNMFSFAFDTHNARIGADYNLSKRAIIGFTANGIFNKGRIHSDSRAQSLNAQSQGTGYFNTIGNNAPDRSNKAFNLNYKQTLDTAGRELTADLDYASFHSDEIQNYLTDYLDMNRNPAQSPYKLLGDLSGKLNIQSVKVDYTQPLKTISGRLEAGMKSSIVESDNDVQFFNQSNGGNVPDAGKSNHFIYKENINAAYLNASGNFNKISAQVGLRVENTIAEGVQLKDNNSFDKNYTQLFPSGYLGYKFTENNVLGLSLSRRINRPSYRQLNPFKVFLDPATSSSGNPFLNPEITNSFELTHTLKQKYTTKIGYSVTTDNIIDVLSPDTEPNTVLQTGRNLAKFQYYNLSLGIPVTIGKWLNSTNNATFYYGKYTGELVNTRLDASRATFNLNSNNTLILNGTTTAEVSAFYQGKNNYGFLVIDPIWSMSIGVQKQLFDKKASVKLNLSDVFFTNNVDGSTLLTGYGERFLQSRDTRVLTLSLNYRFGKTQVPGSRRRTGGAEDEKRRAG